MRHSVVVTGEPLLPPSPDKKGISPGRVRRAVSVGPLAHVVTDVLFVPFLRYPVGTARAGVIVSSTPPTDPDPLAIVESVSIYLKSNIISFRLHSGAQSGME